MLFVIYFGLVYLWLYGTAIISHLDLICSLVDDFRVEPARSHAEQINKLDIAHFEADLIGSDVVKPRWLGVEMVAGKLPADLGYIPNEREPDGCDFVHHWDMAEVELI